MTTHALFHHWPSAPPKTQGAGSRPATDLRLAVKGYWMKARSERWMSEEEAKTHGRHTLLEDNPASG